MMGHGNLAVAVSALLFSGVVLAQESAHFKIKMPVLNSGGHPVGGTTPTSASFLLRPDAIGESAVEASSTSASFRLSGGFLQSSPAPGEVDNLEFTDSVTLDWDAEPFACHYHLYRTDPMGMPTGSSPVGVCLEPDVVGVTTTDGGVPPGGRAYFYFVNAVSCTRIEGPAGAIGTLCQ